MTLRNRLLGVAAGVALDAALGEVPGPHPVAGFGRVMLAVEARLWRDQRSAGVGHAAVGTGLGLLAGALAPSVAVAAWVTVAARGLDEAARRVEEALVAGDLPRARAALPRLVGRDPSALDEKEIARAVVESVAENAVDALVVPVWWGAVAGAPGACAARAVNTLDAMVGYRSPRYRHFGWASARLDDAAAFVPARLTALAVALLCPSRAGAILEAVRHEFGDQVDGDVRFRERTVKIDQDLPAIADRSGLRGSGVHGEARTPGRDNSPAPDRRPLRPSRGSPEAGRRGPGRGAPANAC